MVFGLRVEDRLDGAANFSPWKARISLILEENELWDIVHSTTTNHVVVLVDATDKAAFMKRDVKKRRIILDVVKDHVIPHISAKDHAFQMWTTLTNLCQSSNENNKMVLREKLKSVCISKGESMASYLTRITQVRDELAVVGEVIGSPEIVRTTLNGVSQQWTVFVQTIIDRENIPTWDRLWDDLTQEEIRRGFI